MEGFCNMVCIIMKGLVHMKSMQFFFGKYNCTVKGFVNKKG